MKGYVEFTGKTLDEAIKEACDYFGVPREKLEIEIVNDAKTGIFGLVGAKKATLRARRVQLGDIGLNLGETTTGKGEKGGKSRRSGEAKSSPASQKNAEIQTRPESSLALRKENLPAAPVTTEPAKAGLPGEERGERPGPGKRGQKNSARKEPSAQIGQPGQFAQPAKDRPEGNRHPKKAEGARSNEGHNLGTRDKQPLNNPAGDNPAGDNPTGGEQARHNPAKHNQEGRERKRGGAEPADRSGKDASSPRPPRSRNAGNRTENGEGPELSDDAMPDFAEQLPLVPLESIDQELLRATVLDALRQLIYPIVGEAEIAFEISDARVRLHVNCAENHGLLIGRDGQTLASLQYLLSCIASRKLNASVRIQIDAGDYREKQDEKLRELALSLAQKVKASARPQSTRPLSAYHRRIIHMTLQDDPEVQTHSKGEGGLKRVVVVPRRKPQAV